MFNADFRVAVTPLFVLSGEEVANAALSATLHGMTNETQIHFDSSGVQVYDVRFIDVDGDVHIEAGAVQVGGDTKVKSRRVSPFRSWWASSRSTSSSAPVSSSARPSSRTPRQSSRPTPNSKARRARGLRVATSSTSETSRPPS